LPKSAEIAALRPFSTATPITNNSKSRRFFVRLFALGSNPSAMRRNSSSLFSRPQFLLVLTALLTALLLQSGEMGSSDTTRRLQNTHSFWTNEPPVRAEDYPDFGLIGRNGTIHGWYGIGQSILMLPFDIAGSWLAGMPMFASLEGHDPSVREMVVSYSCNVLVCMLSVLMCFRFMRRLEFTVNQALAGALGLLFGTTFLHYTQNMMENNLILLLDLAGFCYQYEWLCSGRARSLLIGSAALGANLLVRLTTGMDIMACGLFLLLIVVMGGVRGSKLRLLSNWVRLAPAVYAFFFAMDRLYQWYRYGSIFNTYLGVFVQQLKERNGDLPAKFPWTTPWREGILGPLITPEKSIFLFDPLIILTLILALLLWKHMRPQTKAWVLATGSLICGYILFYARYYIWSGDFAWGDRYVSTPVQLLAMMAIPLLLQHRAKLNIVVWRTAWGIVAASIAAQLASVVFWHPLEVYQVMTMRHPTFVVGLRFKNIIADILGKYGQWGLTNDWMWKDQWQRFHSTTPYFMPFMLWRDGSVRLDTAHVLIAAWSLLVAALIGVLLLIRTKARRKDFEDRVTGTSPEAATG
jgi:hypothetical protein